MHLENNFCTMQSEIFGTELNCAFTSVRSPRQESCDSLSSEQYSYTPPPQNESYYPYSEKTSLMSATSAISGALEELHSESYLQTDEWSQSLETFLTSLQPDSIPDIFTSENRQSHCEIRERLPYINLENSKPNFVQTEEIDNYLCPSRNSISPMVISPRLISFMDSKFQTHVEDVFTFEQPTSPKTANSFFFNENTQKSHALQEMCPLMTSNFVSTKHETQSNEYIMDSSEESIDKSLDLLPEEQNLTPFCQRGVITCENNSIGSQIEKKLDDKSEMDEVIGPRACRWVDCNVNFPNRESLSRHIERAHVDQRKGDDFTCFWAACQRRYRPFNARYKLLIHMRVHSGEKPNKCTFKGCAKAFSRLENLKIHMRSHTGERPYICVYSRCGKAFSNSSDRAKHQRTHINAKPYVCTVPGCKKCYTDPSSLRKHVKNHTAKEQALAKRKASDSYLCGANYSIPSFASTNGENGLTSIKNENDESCQSCPRDVVRFSLLCHVLGRRPSKELDSQPIAVPQFTQEDLDTWVST